MCAPVRRIPRTIQIEEVAKEFILADELVDDHQGPYSEIQVMLGADAYWKFSDLESLGIQNLDLASTKHVDTLAVEKFQSGVLHNGSRYVVQLLWKDNVWNELCNNLSVALHRLKKLSTQLKNDRINLDNYHKSVMEYIDSDMAEIVNINAEMPSSTVWYLPHHGIVSWDPDFKIENKMAPLKFKPPEHNQRLKQAAEAKMEDFDFSGTMRRIASNDTSAGYSEEVLEKLRSKHPQALEDIREAVTPYEQPSSLISCSTTRHAIFKMNSGSVAGPYGLRPIYIKHLIEVSNNEAGRNLLSALNSLVQLFVAGQIPEFARDNISGRSQTEIFLVLGDAMKEEVLKKARRSHAFGILTDEVADISVKENLVTFIQFYDRECEQVLVMPEYYG
ncbi:hypothetical protein GQR58_007100 [Nymphon striatum]|nr:hypothetical protein GQR58_007100 [Nymphon striatum]